MFNQKQKSNVHLRKKHKTADRKGGGGGANPYGQPDRKKTVIFFDDFPKECDSMLKRTIVLALVLLWLLVSGNW